MKKAILFATLLLAISPVIGQSVDNVESAERFRDFKSAPQIESTTAIQNCDLYILRVLDHKSSAQLEELGSRFGWGKSNAQLEALGSRFGWGKSNAQLEALGSRFGWGKSNAQLEALGSRFGWGKSNAQLEALGSRFGWENLMHS
jgi:hypothetical protein